MSIKRMFEEDETYNQAGLDFKKEVNVALEEIVKKYSKEGYSLLDMKCLMIDEASLLAAIYRIVRMTETRAEK